MYMCLGEFRDGPITRAKFSKCDPINGAKFSSSIVKRLMLRIVIGAKFLFTKVFEGKCL